MNMNTMSDRITKNGYMGSMATGKSRVQPFVVCSLHTKRYGLSTRKMEKIRPTPLPMPSRDLTSVFHSSLTQESDLPGHVPATVHRGGKDCPPPKPPPPAIVSKGRSLSRTTSAQMSTNAAQKDKIARDSPVLAITSPNGPLLRPGCVPRGRMPRSSAPTIETSKMNAYKAPAARPSGLGIDTRKPSTVTNMARTETVVRGTGASVKKAIVSGCRLGTQTEYRVMQISPSITSPPSPDLSSFPSQTWIIAVSGEVNDEEKQTTNVGTPSSIGDVTKLDNTRGTEVSVKKAAISGECRPGAQAANLVLQISPSVTPLPSPDLSSFPSQSWTTVVGGEAKDEETQITVAGTPFSVGGATKFNEELTRCTGASIEKAAASGKCRSGMQIENLVSQIFFSITPSPSPDLSSFPSQTWITVIGGDGQGQKTRTTTIGTPSGISDTAKPDITIISEDSCGVLKSIPWSPALLSVLVAMSTLLDPTRSPAGPADVAKFSTSGFVAGPNSNDGIGFSERGWMAEAPSVVDAVPHAQTADGIQVESPVADSCRQLPFPMVTSTPPGLMTSMGGGQSNKSKIGSSEKGLFTDISTNVSSATIISRPSSGTTSKETLSRVMERGPAESFTADSKKARTGVRRAFEAARAIFSPPRLTSQPRNEPEASKTMSANVSRVRKLFIPPLDENMKASRNPMTRMEVDMLRARKQVAGGGMMNPRLDSLGSLSAMAIVTKLSAPNFSQL